jgi:3'-5' exoribonuclease
VLIVLPIDLLAIKDGDKVEGLIFISSYIKKLDPTSRAPLNGLAYYHGKTLGFKMWDGNLQNIFNTNNLEGSIVKVTGEVGTYNTKTELTVTSVSFDHGFTDKTAFFKSVDVPVVFQTFVDFINTSLSQNAVALVSHIFSAEALFDPFKTTFAGARMHDAQVGGLMNHTMKMLNIAKVLVANDERLAPYADLLYVNIILHDIGKVKELDFTTYTLNSFVTHRTMGMEYIIPHKDKVIELFSETFYYHILAVQQGHHGEYGDKPTTIWAYIIHLIDMVESQTTAFLDKLSVGEIKVKNGQKTVWNNGTDLVV